MLDILSFNTFITQDVLVFFYYVGAVLIPVILYFFKDYIVEHISFIKTINNKLQTFYSAFSANEKIAFWMIFITIFLCMELCWRMVFEAMIGYFDIHEYLHIISKKLK
ncbi:MAG: hypothetical protein P794_08055 [Epsilonproteobacteria bacterium (ex Lamellibrachia satsuma)]|nr:MAG: hypothetical protein P794_08055 [Epsilonproteobacteria bacterium (ex Lamellibrachia satsuma)]